MNFSQPHAASVLSLEQQQQLHRLCVAFQQAWESGQRPAIEHFLSQHSELPRSVLLRELLPVELSQLRVSGQTPQELEYLGRFPDEHAVVAAAFQSSSRDSLAGGVSTVDVHGAGGGGRPDDTSIEDEVPDRLGRFIVRKRLGQGAFGVVYLAQDPQLERLVALKVPRRNRFASDDALQVFLAEARTAARLKHPGLVAVYDVSELDGVPVIVQEYVDGSNVADWARATSPEPQQITRLMIELSEAVGFAHQQQFVHRDLKPANVLIDAQGHPHVTDFGLAVHESGQRLQRGQRAGSPAYMSPELVRGETHHLDGRSDIWSLGVILYELLVGQRPFTGETLEDIFQEIESREPKPPRQIRPEVPRVLERICLRCLSKPIAERYATTADLADDLRAWLKRQPRTSPAARRPPASTWIRTAGWTLGFAATVTVAILILHMVRSARTVDIPDPVTALVSAMANNHGPNVPAAIASLQDLPRDVVLEALRRQFAEAAPNQQLPLAYALADLGAADVPFLVSQVGNAPDEEAANLVTALSHAQAEALPAVTAALEAAGTSGNQRLKARLAMVALQLNDAVPAALMCRPGPDASDRTVFVDESAHWHGNLIALVKRLVSADDPHLRAAVCLAIGGLSRDQLAADVEQVWRQQLERWHEEQPDAGTHSASGWALRNWQLPLPVVPESSRPRPGFDWLRTAMGLTLVRIPANSFQRQDEGPGEQPRQTVHLSEFLLGDREITVQLFLQFVADREYQGEKPTGWDRFDTDPGLNGEQPMSYVTWYDAVMFCNWLSQREGRPLCYERTGEKEPIPDLNLGVREFDAWRLIPARAGYRLPTEAEWEYACRAGTTTWYFTGDDESLLRTYSVFDASQTQATGRTRCNPWGLFDMPGNVWEWCQDGYGPYGTEAEVVDPIGTQAGTLRARRGGACGNPASSGRSANRDGVLPNRRGAGLGFRVALVP